MHRILMLSVTVTVLVFRAATSLVDGQEPRRHHANREAPSLTTMCRLLLFEICLLLQRLWFEAESFQAPHDGMTSTGVDPSRSLHTIFRSMKSSSSIPPFRRVPRISPSFSSARRLLTRMGVKQPTFIKGVQSLTGIARVC